jgi:hypothetical protein
MLQARLQRRRVLWLALEVPSLQISEAKRLRELEAENGKLKKLLAEAHLEVEALKVAFGVKR